MHPPEIDPMDAILAAPHFHRVLLENETVRVLDTLVRPGETVPLHTHRWPAVLYIVSWSDCVRRDKDGRVTMDSRNATVPQPGDALWSAPLPPHTLENVGDRELRVIAVEQKPLRPAKQ
jgi:mannose-6-phosphate isomerase-like protein (cupin superfamily)